MSDRPVVARSRAALAEALAAARRRGRVGFVPTMGALHEGHLSLVRASVEACEVTVVSVFVNRTQFGPAEDFAAYPRQWESDRAALAAAGVDVVFHPPEEEVYPDGAGTFIEVPGLSGKLCGAFRPGHFRGVATVVWKLLQLVDPEIAFFGAKDAQQVLVIRRMVADLFGRWEIRSLPTVREEGGLALSSRNAYLTAEERRAACVLHRALEAGRAALEEGERDAERVVSAVKRTLAGEPLVRPEYVELLSLRELADPGEARGDLLLAVAARLGRARLIDNVALRVGDRVEEILP